MADKDDAKALAELRADFDKLKASIAPTPNAMRRRCGSGRVICITSANAEPRGLMRLGRRDIGKQ
jgi:hypothetical protein